MPPLLCNSPHTPLPTQPSPVLCFMQQLEAKGRDDRGFTVLAFAQPVHDINPGSWSITVNYTVQAPAAAAVTAAAQPSSNPRPSVVGAGAAAAAGLAASGGAAAASNKSAVVSLQELSTARVVTFDGAYSPNARGVLARCAWVCGFSSCWEHGWQAGHTGCGRLLSSAPGIGNAYSTLGDLCMFQLMLTY